MMARRPKHLAQDAGAGISDDILDHAFWRAPHQPDDDWVAALDQLDRLGDKKPLTALLRGDRELMPSVRHYIADLIERGVPKAIGRPRTPAYNISNAEAMLLLGCRRVAEHVADDGMTVADALALVGQQLGIHYETLNNAYQQRRGATRRKARNTRP